MSFKKDGEVKVYKSKDSTVKYASEPDHDAERFTVDELVEEVTKESEKEKANVSN